MLHVHPKRLLVYIWFMETVNVHGLRTHKLSYYRLVLNNNFKPVDKSSFEAFNVPRHDVNLEYQRTWRTHAN